MNNLLHDLRFAIRQMRRSPAFAVTAVLILALGIAANVIVFGVIQALVLRPLDVPHPDQVKTLGTTNLAFPVLAYQEVRSVRDYSTAFSAVAAVAINNFGLEADGATRPVWGYEVSGQYFEVFGIKPYLGRLLQRADDDHPGASNAAVLSWPAWKTDFGADPNVLGKKVLVNKHPYTIVGVTPEGFYGTERFLQPDIFVPIANQESLDGASWLEQWHDKNVGAIVRIKDGVTAPQAEAELKAVAARVRRQHPTEEEGLGFKLAQPGLLGDFLGSPARAFLAGVMGLAAILLLAACANLGSLFAARTADRTREIAIRMAIGSSRWRILRQVLVEALVISIAGGACACGLALSALTGLASWHPPTDYPIRFAVLPQPSLILIALVISVFTAVLFGLMPLRQIFKTDPNDSMKSGAVQTAAGRRWALRDLLLATQIALCCVTVTAAFVSLRGLGRALHMDLGFEPRHATRTAFDLAQSGYSPDTAARFQRQLLEKIAQIPGVTAAAYAGSTPLAGNGSMSDVFPQQTSDFRPSAKAFSEYFFDVSPGYFATAGTHLLAGRDIRSTDTAKTPLVAVVNREFARRLFHYSEENAGSAIGRYFKNHSGQSIQIVGIVADGKYLALSEDPQGAAFFPIAQQPDTATEILARSSGDLAGMSLAIRRAIHDLDPTIPIRSSGQWKTQLELVFFPAEAATVALSIFGAFGLLLSIAGAFGLASYTVTKRLRELSIRVALGGRAKQILSAALGRVLILLAGGSVIGVVLGMAASKLLSAIVYQASAQDPLVLGAVALTMMLTGSLAVIGPVRRALQIDPATLLREL